MRLARIYARCMREDRGYLTPCLIWQGAHFTKGYGGIKIEGKVRYVHRLVVEHERGPIPPGMTTDHLCNQKDCCEATHLEVVTSGENQRRGWAYRGDTDARRAKRV